MLYGIMGPTNSFWEPMKKLMQVVPSGKSIIIGGDFDVVNEGKEDGYDGENGGYRFQRRMIWGKLFLTLPWSSISQELTF